MVRVSGRAELCFVLKWNKRLLWEKTVGTDNKKKTLIYGGNSSTYNRNNRARGWPWNGQKKNLSSRQLLDVLKTTTQARIDAWECSEHKEQSIGVQSANDRTTIYKSLRRIVEMVEGVFVRIPDNLKKKTYKTLVFLSMCL